MYERSNAANVMPTTPEEKRFRPPPPPHGMRVNEINISVRGIRYPPFLPTTSTSAGIFIATCSHCHHDHNLRGDEVGAVLALMINQSSGSRRSFSTITTIILNDHNRATHLYILHLTIFLDGIDGTHLLTHLVKFDSFEISSQAMFP